MKLTERIHERIILTLSWKEMCKNIFYNFHIEIHIDIETKEPQLYFQVKHMNILRDTNLRLKD